jgi:hypothetical protein
MSPFRAVPIDILMFGDRVIGIDIGNIIVIGAIIPLRSPNRLIVDIHTEIAAHGSRAPAIDGG